MFRPIRRPAAEGVAAPTSRRFLTTSAPAPPPARGPSFSASLLGGAAGGAERWLSQFPTWAEAPGTAGAVLFADQSKAFERLAWSWIAAVLARWRLPPWLLRGLLGLVTGRRVASLRPSELTIVRILLCGVGIEGPASPLIWMTAYDPVVFGVACAAGAPTPTYVDDLAAYPPPPAVPAGHSPPPGRRHMRRPQGRDA